MPAARRATESRREPRSDAVCHATARVAVSIELVDASTRGVRARISLPLPIGTTLKIALPGQVERHARIAWTDGDDYGCEFMAPLTRSELAGVLAATDHAHPRFVVGR